MTIRLLTGGWLLTAAMLTGCATPDATSLQESFAEQVEAVSSVRNFQRNGDELEFSAPDVTGADAMWRVHIDSAVVEPQEDEIYPYQGVVTSSWYANGELVEPVGVMSFLPTEFLDQGIGQECWAFWDEESGRWDW